MRLLFIFVCSVCISTLSVAQTLNQTIVQAKQYENTRNYAAMYQLLLPLEGEFGGNPEFDFYLGLAALENKKPSEAIFALERAIAIQPDFTRARAELGRAYFMLGENENAKAEFETVKADNRTPAGVINTLDNFLAAIDSRFDSAGKRLEFFIDTTLGSDSNINAGTDAENITILFGDFELSAPLSEESQATESDFYSIKPGVRYSTPLRDDLNLYLAADLVISEPSEEQYAAESSNISATLAKLAGSTQYQGALAVQSYEVPASEFVRDSVTLSGQWIKTLNAKNKLNAYLSLADVSYEDGIKDGAVNGLGINWLNSIGKFANYYGLFYGDEGIDDPLQQQQAKDYMGIKIGTRRSIGRSAFYANLSVQENSFKAIDILQGVKRDGTSTSLSLGMDIPILQKLTLSPSVSLIENKTDNNIEVFEYERTLVNLTFGYKF